MGPNMGLGEVRNVSICFVSLVVMDANPRKHEFEVRQLRSVQGLSFVKLLPRPVVEDVGFCGNRAMAVAVADQVLFQQRQ